MYSFPINDEELSILNQVLSRKKLNSKVGVIVFGEQHQRGYFVDTNTGDKLNFLDVVPKDHCNFIKDLGLSKEGKIVFNRFAIKCRKDLNIK